jgi:UDP-GlcNAc:undecaprenyl-phosphate GlcNAc-1-phosphate transferase
MVLANLLAEAQPITTVRALAAEFWPIAVISFVLSLAATPLCRAFALKRKIVDRPDDFLKPHKKPIPYLGGIAIALGWLGGLLAAIAMGSLSIRTGVVLGIAGAGGFTVLIGLFDDLSVMSARVKLVFNLIVGFMLIGLGLGDDIVRIISDPLSPQISREQEWLIFLYSLPVTLLIVVGASNATNLIDGLDGLCSGVLGIIAIGFLLIAGHMRLYGDLAVSDERIVLALSMLGAAAGFLPYNRNPATIFMGDAGSMLLGFNAAVLILLFAEEAMLRWMIGAVMVFGLPIADMMLAMARRWRNGRSLMEGDRSHFYDQLVDRGLSVKRVVSISYLLTLAFVVAGTSVVFLSTRYAILICFGAVVAVLVAISRFNMAGIERDRRRELSSGEKD